MGEEFLRLENIDKRFAGVHALKNVSLTIEQGRIYCMVGENGSGKSTLIKVISGVHAPDLGEIIIEGKSFKRLHPIDSIREGIQVIYQDFSLFPNLTVAENIALNYEISSNWRLVNWKKVNEIAAGALKRVNIDLDLDALVGNLPVADRQLIAISKALLQNAKLIIMDEPTTALTQKEIKSLFQVIDNLKKEGLAILFVSHKLDEVLEIANQIIIIRNGEKVMDCPATGLDRASMVQAMIGRKMEDDVSKAATLPEDAPVLLKADHLSAARSFTDISFELHAGEILGITGLLGSGRTALALSLFGILPPDSGSVCINGQTVNLRTIQDAIRNGIGYVPEDRLTEGLFLPQSIGKNMVVSIVDNLQRNGLLDLKAVGEKVIEWAERLRILTNSTALPVNSLSGGNQQRVVLAKWLAREPRVLILNGPTVGVDIGSKAEIHDIIRDLAQRGMGLLVISDDIPELMHICHRILLMRKGKIAEELDRRKITEAELNKMLVNA